MDQRYLDTTCPNQALNLLDENHQTQSRLQSGQIIKYSLKFNQNYTNLKSSQNIWEKMDFYVSVQSRKMYFIPTVEANQHLNIYHTIWSKNRLEILIRNFMELEAAEARSGYFCEKYF